MAPHTSGSYVFPLDRQVLSQSFDSILDGGLTPPPNHGGRDEQEKSMDNEARRRKLEEIRDEDWDIFLKILRDGSLVIRGVAVRVNLPCSKLPALSRILSSISIGGRQRFSSNLPCSTHRPRQSHFIVCRPSCFFPRAFQIMARSTIHL